MLKGKLKIQPPSTNTLMREMEIIYYVPSSVTCASLEIFSAGIQGTTQLQIEIS